MERNEKKIVKESYENDKEGLKKNSSCGQKRYVIQGVIGRGLFAVSVGILALAFAVAPVSAQSLTTYRPDYHPGNIVTIMGSGWAPSETVTLVISENPPINPNVSLNVTTDGSGYFES